MNDDGNDDGDDDEDDTLIHWPTYDQEELDEVSLFKVVKFAENQVTLFFGR